MRVIKREGVCLTLYSAVQQMLYEFVLANRWNGKRSRTSATAPARAIQTDLSFLIPQLFLC